MARTTRARARDDIASQAGRQTLGRLAEIAEAAGVALVIVHHFNKSGNSIGVAIGGGRGVKGVARSILIWGDEPVAPVVPLPGTTDEGDEADVRPAVCSVLAHYKSSYRSRQSSLLYERVEHPHPADADVSTTSFEYVGESDYSAERVFEGGSAALSERGRKRGMARELILRFLTTGPRTADDLASDILAAGISERTFTHARAELARDEMIEESQQNGRHWWRLAVPESPPPA